MSSSVKAGFLRDDATGALVLAGTASGASDFSMDAGKRITLSTGLSTGSIERLITLQSNHQYGRAWISWLDEAGRHRVGSGFHHINATDSNDHSAYEIKTSVDPAGTSPAGAGDMRTRFSIKTDMDIATATFDQIDHIYVSRGWNVAGSPVKFHLRMPTAAGSDTDMVTLAAQMDASDNVTGYLDAIAPAAGKTAQLVVFRNNSFATASSPSFRIKKGDGTNTDVFTFLAGTGSGSLTFAEGVNLIVGTTTGTKIGTATTQKLGFFNATPVVQQTLAAAASDPATTQALANSLRTALINLGLGA
jgi:hypothetical protein